MTLQFHPLLKDLKLIPLTTNTKIARVKWGTDNTLKFNGQENGYAIDTGRSNLVIIDCDRKENIDGITNFFELAEQHNQTIPDTFTVQTPNDGLHFYFTQPPGTHIKSSIGTIAPGIDIRASGGYIVAPGSTIKTEQGDLKTYTPENDNTPIQELPQWLTTLAKQQEQNTTKNTPNTKKDTPKKTKTPPKKDQEKNQVLHKNIFYWATNKLEQAQEGERQKTLNSVCLFLGQARVPVILAQGIVTIAENIGLPQDEAKRTFKHGYYDGLEKEELDFEQIAIKFNVEMNVDFKSDPLDTAYYTHVALSHNFAKKHPNNYIYWTENSSWYRYKEDTGYWEKIDEQELVSQVETFLDQLVTDTREELKNIPSHIYKLHEKLWVKNYIESVTSVCRNRYINTTKNLFDNNPLLLNVKNGVVNLADGTISEHSRDHYITNYIPFNYNAKAKDKYADQVIESIHPEEREFAQLMIGQALVGEQPTSQIAIFLHGRGSNGKSTLLDLIARTGGSYCRLQPPGVLLGEKSGGDKYALSDFENLRTAVIEELPNSKVLDTGALKRLVGTARINARPIYGKNREFRNQATLFVSCNRLPLINETDHGTWRRVMVVSFPFSYKKSRGDVKGEFDRLADPLVLHSANRSIATAEAFLAWRIQGAVRWAANEKSEYEVPEHILATVSEWNENNDMLLTWFNTCLESSPDTVLSYITLEDLWKSYNELLLSRGNSPISMRIFIEQFLNHSVYYDNNLTYKKSSRISIKLKRSVYYPMDDSNYIPKPTPTHAAHIIGAKFKEE